MSTIFSKIITREIPAHLVYEDDYVIAFLDISQATKGHTLVVPKIAYKDIFDVPEKTASHVFGVAVKLSKAIKKAFGVDAMNVLSNNGEVAGQTVFHFHIHLIPRYRKDDENLFKLKNNQGDLSIDDYQTRAKLIREAL
ncbi:MAG: HIT family protein [Acholeplasmataceae bacterium]|jgi:histidine triad (HIT) family protein|nr:HIT family protein [Acholeplasmataceae bacterium]